MRLAPLILVVAACLTAIWVPPAQGSAPHLVSSQQAKARFLWFTYAGSDPADRLIAQPADTYRNPILQGFYSDPSIVRVGRYFYLATSTFVYFPGIPIFRSTDLVHWRQVGNAIDRPDQMDLSGLRASKGLYAPAISWHAGRYYLVDACVDCGGTFVITAQQARGPWSKPTWLPHVDGIDPSLFFDDDGSAWIVNNGPPPETPRYPGHRAIWIQRFDPASERTFGTRKVLVDGGANPSTHPIWIEGPHLYKRKGFYYLMAAEGGTAERHSEVVFRSKHVNGPYVADPGNPILTQRDLPEGRSLPITSAGHADLVQTPDGEWWATFLGVRPYSGDLYNTGRETFLLPVTWRDGWPLILTHATPMPRVLAMPALPAEHPIPPPTSGAFRVRTTFAAPTLPLDWMMLRTPRRTWWHLDHGLVLDARAAQIGELGNPSFIGRRQQHRNADVETAMVFVPDRTGDRAGLVAIQNNEHFFFLGVVREAEGDRIELRERAGADQRVDGRLISSTPVFAPTAQPIRLGLAAKDGRYAFRYALPGLGWRTLASGVDGTILSTKVAGGFVGTVIGVYAARNPREEK